MALFGAEAMRQFNRFVEHDSIGDLDVVEQFCRADAEDDALHLIEVDVHPGDMGFQLFVQRLALSDDLVDELLEVLLVHALEILFFDEPSAGLDPITAKRLDDLILEIRDSIGSTLVVVSHELASIFAIADRAVFLDAESKTMIAEGAPKELAASSQDERIRRFLTREETFHV